MSVEPTQKIALYVVTKHGLAHALRLARAAPGAVIYVSQRLELPHLSSEDAATFTVQPLRLPIAPVLAETFGRYTTHIFVLSVGAVVRLIAPLLVDKKHDPAVVCIDDAARFAICLCSGHVGRGNQQSAWAARVLQATPVITTASDVLGTLGVDILGRDLGWTLDDPERNVTRTSGAVVNDEAVAFVQETGEPEFWPLDRELPANIRYTTQIDEIAAESYSGLLICSDRLFEQSHPQHWQKAVIYRPKSLIVGMGCDRNTPPDLVRRGCLELLVANKLALASVAALATVDLKADEPALLDLCREFSWPLLTFSASQLDVVPNLPSPSAMVAKHIGTRGVAEPAAVLGSANGALIVNKTIYTEVDAGKSMTFAVARRHYASRRIAGAL